jgi:hypothetical protein
VAYLKVLHCRIRLYRLKKARKNRVNTTKILSRIELGACPLGGHFYTGLWHLDWNKAGCVTTVFMLYSSTKSINTDCIFCLALCNEAINYFSMKLFDAYFSNRKVLKNFGDSRNTNSVFHSERGSEFRRQNRCEWGGGEVQWLWSAMLQVLSAVKMSTAVLPVVKLCCLDDGYHLFWGHSEWVIVGRWVSEGQRKN